MSSIHNEGKSVVAERRIRTLKTKIYKLYMIWYELISYMWNEKVMIVYLIVGLIKKT